MKLKLDDYDYKYIVMDMASKPLNGEFKNYDFPISLEVRMRNGEAVFITATHDDYELLRGDDIECDFDRLNSLIRYYRESHDNK